MSYAYNVQVLYYFYNLILLKNKLNKLQKFFFLSYSSSSSSISFFSTISPFLGFKTEIVSSANEK